MSTHRSTWKAREREAAGLFGAKRQRCSGSSGRDDCSRSDSTHPTLFIETKTRAKCSTRTLYDATRELAKAERKIPVLLLAAKGRPGFLVVAHSDDMPAVAEHYLTAQIPADVEPPPEPSGP
jgi:hypothetical protein